MRNIVPYDLSDQSYYSETRSVRVNVIPRNCILLLDVEELCDFLRYNAVFKNLELLTGLPMILKNTMTHFILLPMPTP